MSFEFQWRVQDEQRDEGSLQQKSRRRLWPWFLLGILSLFVVSLLAWPTSRTWLRTLFSPALSEEERIELHRTLNLYLDLEQRAASSGDPALFLSTQADDPAWIATQFHPLNQAIRQETVEIVDVGGRAANIWATVQWRNDQEYLQRVFFYQREAGALVRVPYIRSYWGDQEESQQSWGTLRIYEKDTLWQTEIGHFVEQVISELCPPTSQKSSASNPSEQEENKKCLSKRLPLSLTVRSRFGTTAAPHTVEVPSPRLIALTTANEPAERFWQLLEQRLHEYLAPPEIRHAVPTHLTNRFEQLATTFMLNHSQRRVRIVSQADLPNDSDDLLALVDSAYMIPTPELITAGHIHDLTYFTENKVAFDMADFYPAIWDGGVWQKRLWMLPHSASLRLLYVSQADDSLQNLIENSSLSRDLIEHEMSVIQRQLDNARLKWMYIDETRDLLFARALSRRCRIDTPFNWVSTTMVAAPADADQSERKIDCSRPLRKQDLIETIQWYQQQVTQSFTPDLSALADEERKQLVLNALSVPPQVVYWIGAPTHYEHYQQQHSPHILPLISEEEILITPLRVAGNVISQHSVSPRAAWEWIEFLSTQRPVSRARHIPARPSTARRIGYWQKIPTAVDEVLQVSFASAQAIRIEERRFFDWSLGVVQN
ncbi:hypothetical protein KFU94_46200 [Chloroflexi bacterium TSY]|nr:hypothetical protein [Chloroflexi bacterium TSY]